MRAVPQRGGDVWSCHLHWLDFLALGLVAWTAQRLGWSLVIGRFLESGKYLR